MIQYSESLQVLSTIFYGFAIALSLILKKLLRNSSEKNKRIPVLIIGGIILLLEVNKQIINAFGYDYTNIFAFFSGDKKEFSTYALPFHFCSFFIFWILFQFIFIKNKKLFSMFENLAYLWSTVISVLIILYPEMIYPGAVKSLYSTGQLEHTIPFHVLTFVYWTVATALRTYNFKIKNIYQGPLCFIIFGLFAIPAAHIFKENYCSLYSAEGWGFLEGVFAQGYFVYNSVLVLIGMVVSTTVFISIVGVENLRNKVKNNKYFIIGSWIYVVLIFILLMVSYLIGFEKLQPIYAILLVGLYFLTQLPGYVINLKK